MNNFKKFAILLLILAVGVVTPLTTLGAKVGLHPNAELIISAIEAAGITATFVDQTREEFIQHDIEPTDAETVQVLALVASAGVIRQAITDSGLDLFHPFNLIRIALIIDLIEQAANIFCLTSHVDVVNQTVSTTPIPNCVRIIPREALCELVVEAEARDSANYTPRSWANLQSMIVLGRNVCHNPTAVEVQINEAITLLNARLDALEPR